MNTKTSTKDILDEQLEAMYREQETWTADIGMLDFPDLNTADFDFLLNQDFSFENRYLKPKRYRPSQRILYDNAKKLAKEIKFGEGDRIDLIIGGNFIFGDFIEAFIQENNIKVAELTISTLSLSYENIQSLFNLMQGQFVDKLNLIVSSYFYAHERRGLIQNIYEALDQDEQFQLAVADIHTKTAHFKTLGGKKIVIHGSANLRSSGNIEQFTIEENPELFDFYQEVYTSIIERFKTIDHSVRGKELWRTIYK